MSDVKSSSRIAWVKATSKAAIVVIILGFVNGRLINISAGVAKNSLCIPISLRAY